MTDIPEETARKRQLLKELIEAEQEAGLYDEIVIPEESVAITKQVRKELYGARGSKTVSDTEKYLFTDAERDAYAWGVKDAEDALNDDEYDRVVSESIYLGELRARNRIVSQLKEYVEDLRICSKNDSCADIANAIQGQIEEITGEEMDNEEFIDGMAEVHEVVYTTLDRLQQSINDMMGVYMDMPEDITKQNPEVKELSAMYAVLTQFREMFIDNYDEAMRNYHSSKNQTL